MGNWDFPGRRSAIAEATAVLALRDQVAAAAGALGLEPDDALRRAYEDARDGFAGATTLANDQLAALAAVADAKAKVDAAPDLLAQVGLIGETPERAVRRRSSGVRGRRPRRCDRRRPRRRAP